MISSDHYQRRFFSLRERLARDSRDEGECRIWTGTYDDKGYGLLCFKGRRSRAHRFAWIDNYGVIPSGMHVCHHCDRPSCINPNHLFLGTHLENMQDKARKGRQIFGEKSQNAKLTDANVRAIRDSTESNLVLAKEYGVHNSVISTIRTRKAWKHVT